MLYALCTTCILCFLRFRGGWHVLINIALCNCAIVHIAIFLFRFCTFCEHFFFIVHREYISSLNGVNCVHISRAWESMIFWQMDIRCPTAKMSKILQWQKCWGRCACFSTFGAIELRRYPTNVGDEDDEEEDIAFVDVVPWGRPRYERHACVITSKCNTAAAPCGVFENSKIHISSLNCKISLHLSSMCDSKP